MSLKKYMSYATIDNISRGISKGNIFHGYILEGAKELPKDEIAKELIKAVACQVEPGTGCDRCAACRRITEGNYLDLYEVFPENDSNVKTKQIASLMSDLARTSIDGGYKFAIIHMADRMEEAAQNKFLKTLEEPAEKTVIILICDNKENLLQTVRSRCVTISLGYDSDGFDGNLGKEILQLIREGAFFYKITDKFDKKIISREMALRLLDDMELVVGGELLKISLNQAEREIGAIEEARSNIVRNMNYKYALKAMILKIGG